VLVGKGIAVRLPASVLSASSCSTVSSLRVVVEPEPGSSSLDVAEAERKVEYKKTLTRRAVAGIASDSRAEDREFDSPNRILGVNKTLKYT
jgi:archaellin